MAPMETEDPAKDQASRLWSEHSVKMAQKRNLAPVLYWIFGALALVVIAIGLWIVAVQ
jgi:hypothetical protein